MHVPMIEINLHNITRYQKQHLFSFNCKMFAKVNHVVNLNVKKDDPSIYKPTIKLLYNSRVNKVFTIHYLLSILTKTGFHSPTSVLDQGRWASSLLISRMTNFTKCTTRSCLSTGYFFRAAEETFT